MVIMIIIFGVTVTSLNCAMLHRASNISAYTWVDAGAKFILTGKLYETPLCLTKQAMEVDKDRATH